jgi:hypothetical protein
MSATDDDWTKPAALAIPKEGYFELERGGTGRFFRALRRLRILDHREGQGGSRGRDPRTRQESKQRSPKRRSSSLHYDCTTFAGCSSMSAMA